MQIRPTFLIIEPEPSEALSTRKLVIETSKFNVITAYSGREGLALFGRFPKVDAVIVHADIRDVECDLIAKQVKKKNGDLTVIYLRPNEGMACSAADISVSSHDPVEVVTVLRSMFGDPRAMSD